MTVLGTPRVRPDAGDKVSGRTLYTADVRLDGTPYAALARSPHPFAKIKRVNVDRARGMPGVAAIAYSGNVPSEPLDFGIKDQHLFPLDFVRFAGEPVAAVAAATPDQARAAADAIDVDYEPMPPVLTIDEAL